MRGYRFCPSLPLFSFFFAVFFSSAFSQLHHLPNKLVPFFFSSSLSSLYIVFILFFLLVSIFFSFLSFSLSHFFFRPSLPSITSYASSSLLHFSFHPSSLLSSFSLLRCYSLFHSQVTLSPSIPRRHLLFPLHLIFTTFSASSSSSSPSIFTLAFLFTS